MSKDQECDSGLPAVVSAELAEQSEGGNYGVLRIIAPHNVGTSMRLVCPEGR